MLVGVVTYYLFYRYCYYFYYCCYTYCYYIIITIFIISTSTTIKLSNTDDPYYFGPGFTRKRQAKSVTTLDTSISSNDLELPNLQNEDKLLSINSIKNDTKNILNTNIRTKDIQQNQYNSSSSSINDDIRARNSINSDTNMLLNANQAANLLRSDGFNTLSQNSAKEIRWDTAMQIERKYGYTSVQLMNYMHLYNSTLSTHEKRIKGCILLQPIFPFGHSTLALDIVSIDIEDEREYVDPVISIKIVDSRNDLKGPIQNTPACLRQTRTSLNFDKVVYIQIPVEDILPTWFIVAELKHFKKKKYISSRCWTYFKVQDVSEYDGKSLKLPLFRKPTNVVKKARPLISNKEMYLHLNLSISRG